MEISLPSFVSISSTSLKFWVLVSFLRSSAAVTWFIVSGGVLGAPVLSFTPEPKTPLDFFEFEINSLSVVAQWCTVFWEFCELFLVPETVVNLTKCLLAMRPMSAVFRTLGARGVHKKHIYDLYLIIRTSVILLHLLNSTSA